MSLLFYRGKLPNALRTLVCLSLLLGFSAFAGGVKADYLPRIGPAALRFRAGPEPGSLMVKAPVVAVVPSQKSVASPARVKVVETPDRPLGPVLVPSWDDPNALVGNISPLAQTAPANPTSRPAGEEAAAEFNDPVLSNQVASQAREGDVLTPQMMLQYFQRQPDGPQNQETGVVVPVAFSPPPPEPTKSSKASYTIR